MPVKKSKDSKEAQKRHEEEQRLLKARREEMLKAMEKSRKDACAGNLKAVKDQIATLKVKEARLEKVLKGLK